ncbi:MAG: outer membrane lipoprotein LolB [Pseudomonadales bacterium]
MLPPRAAVDREETVPMLAESGPPAFSCRLSVSSCRFVSRRVWARDALRRKASIGISGVRALVAIMLCSTVVACASRPVPPPAGGFELSGKLSVAEGQRSLTARFRWRQVGHDFAIELWGPLGQGRLRLEGDDKEVRVIDASGAVLASGSHDAVMKRELGFTLPLAVLPDWVQGQPHSGLPVTAAVRDPTGHLEQFHQLDWVVNLDNWRGDQAANQARPGRITASRGAYRVRLAVSEWHL